jgi:hypothetical protein
VEHYGQFLDRPLLVVTIFSASTIMSVTGATMSRLSGNARAAIDLASARTLRKILLADIRKTLVCEIFLGREKPPRRSGSILFRMATGTIEGTDVDVNSHQALRPVRARAPIGAASVLRDCRISGSARPTRSGR